MNWTSRKTYVLSDIVRYTEGDEFPGFFSMKFSNNCWSLDNKRIILATQWKRANVKLKLISILAKIPFTIPS